VTVGAPDIGVQRGPRALPLDRRTPGNDGAPADVRDPAGVLRQVIHPPRRMLAAGDPRWDGLGGTLHPLSRSGAQKISSVSVPPFSQNARPRARLEPSGVEWNGRQSQGVSQYEPSAATV
jgi:hypothetical protein